MAQGQMLISGSSLIWTNALFTVTPHNPTEITFLCDYRETQEDFGEALDSSSSPDHDHV